ncbi:hypothetical protein ACOSQ2_028671 [Xanthoceras sorbifolium]
MSFEAGPSKSLSSSSSSSSSSNPEEELDLTALIEAQSQLAHAQHRAMLNVYANNNLLMAYYLNQQDSDRPSRGGSILGHNVIHRGREEAAHNLWSDYFVENPRYNELMFRRRFRMDRSLFLRIANEVERHDNYFMQRRDELGRLELSSLQKITSVFRMLAYTVVKLFGERYLRSPNAYDVARLLQIGEKRGFPGMLGSLDCSNNDINVLEASHLFSNLAEGLAPPTHYVIQGKEYNTGYYLADGIYSKWSTLVQTIHDPREACMKDVERAFGVLQSLFAIVKGPARFWNKHVLHDIMSACIIMHNMIVEDERDVHADIDNWREAPAPEVDMALDENTRFQQFLTRHREIRDKEAHIALRNALIEHLWEQYSNSPNY